MLSSKKCNPVVTELFIKRRKLSISLFFIARLNSTHYFLMKILNKRELQQTAFNHLTDIDFQGFMSLYKESSTQPYSFLVLDTTILSNNSLHFRKNLLQTI